MIPKIWRDQFEALHEVPSKGLCGVERFIYTCGLLTDLTFDGLTYNYSARYCFSERAEAIFALLHWDGTGDPPGDWIKEKVSGRVRVDNDD